MDNQELVAIYYPNSYIENNRSLAAYAMYFDELRLVSFIDDSIDPTNRLANLPARLYISSFGGSPNPIYIDRLKHYFEFARRYKDLIGNLIFYDNHLLAAKVNSFVEQISHGESIPMEEFFEFILGKSEEQQAITLFQTKFPELTDDILLRVCPTALHLSKLNNWQLVSDIQELPIPYFSNIIRNADQLSSIIAEECLLLNLPYPQSCNSQELLELRERLSSELVPFRNMMLKAASRLRDQIGNEIDPKLLRVEVGFFVKTNIQPAISELERRIKLEQGKLFRKIFGKSIEYIQIVSNAFLTPSIDNIYKAISKASKDMEDLLLSEYDKAIINDPGVSFLLKASKILS